MSPERLPADEFVARALAQVPRDPAHVTVDDLARLRPVHAALADEAEHVHARMAEIARRLDGPEGEHLGLADLLAAAEEKRLLEARDGRLQIANQRLDRFTAEGAQALGIDLAALLAGD
ncbi:MAG TPA: hypothetical protein VII01_13430 [Solirubrobacteraceae bacterium]